MLIKLPAGRSKAVLSKLQQVYAVKDPHDETIRYVGFKDAQSRLSQRTYGGYVVASSVSYG